jgi:hypothetical protein
MSGDEVKVFIPCGGGLGDVIQAYLANPEFVDCRIPIDQFQTSDNHVSIWFRRLEDFKKKHPKSIVKVICASHNPASVDFIIEHPCVDSVDYKPKIDIEQEGRWWEREIDGYKYITYLYNYKDYKSNKPIIYLTEDEYAFAKELSFHKNIIIFPFAGTTERSPLSESDYIIIIDKLIEKGFTAIVLGGGNGSFSYRKMGVINLVNSCSSRLSTKLVLDAVGFVGVHSSMIIPAWYAKLRSVCIAPTKHDGGQPIEDFINSDNPTAWGFSQQFNKTVIVRDKNNIDYDDIVRWVV